MTAQRRFSGRAALVTGSTQGIGRAIAEQLLAEGAGVVVNCPDQEELDAAVAELSQLGDVYGVRADVTVERDVGRLVEGTERHLGRLDVLIANAGISMIRPSSSLSVADWQRCQDVNATGAFLCARESLEAFRRSGGGAIVNVASITGLAGFPNRAAYVASKHAVVGLTRALAVEWAHLGVRVNAVAPGFVSTGMDETDRRHGDYRIEDIERRTPLGRLGRAGEVAAAVCFLASDEASYITGETIRVDGGWGAFGGWGDARTPPAPAVRAVIDYGYQARRPVGSDDERTRGPWTPA